MKRVTYIGMSDGSPPGAALLVKDSSGKRHRLPVNLELEVSNDLAAQLERMSAYVVDIKDIDEEPSGTSAEAEKASDPID